MDYTEAVEAAVSKRKFLLNSLFNLEDFLETRRLQRMRTLRTKQGRESFTKVYWIDQWKILPSEIWNDRIHTLRIFRSVKAL